MSALQDRLRQLNDELADIDERRAAIQGQIDKAHADRATTGERIDLDWIRRARGALRHLGVERSAVCRDIGEVNRQIRRANHDANKDAFYVAVREVVDDATWDRIVVRHEQIRTERGVA